MLRDRENKGIKPTGICAPGLQMSLPFVHFLSRDALCLFHESPANSALFHFSPNFSGGKSGNPGCEYFSHEIEENERRISFGREIIHINISRGLYSFMIVKYSQPKIYHTFPLTG